MLVLVVFAVRGSNTCTHKLGIWPSLGIDGDYFFFPVPCDKLQSLLLSGSLMPQLSYGSANSNVWDFTQL